MKKRIQKAFRLLIVMTSIGSFAQVGIGTTTPRGALEINSSTNGFVAPQIALTTTNLASPVVNPQDGGAPIVGTQIYNTATAGTGGTAVSPGYYFWNGSLWVRLLTSNTSGWSLLGNSSTVSATNFIGTTDAIDFVTRTNNLERMRINSNGNVGIGTASPVSKLDVATGVTTVNSIVNATGSIDDFLQFNVKNTSTATRAQSGFSATADNGSATTGFAWLGINNSTFNFPTAYNIGEANDVSFVGSGQDMYIANANNTKSIIFSTGKATTPFFNERMRLTNSGKLGIATTTPNSTLNVNGSFAVKLESISTTSTLADDVCKVILLNDGTAITIALPNPTTCIGRMLSFTRHTSSTGTVTLNPSGGNIQNLDGSITATTTIEAHSATGGGVNIQFWSNGAHWYR